MIAEFVLKLAVEKALGKVADLVQTGMKKDDVPIATEAVVKQLAPEIKAIEDHLTNREPWYKSRVTVGSLFALVGSISAIGVMLTDGQPNSIDEYWFHIAAAGGAAYAIYGRFAAKKPIGE